MVGHPSWSLIDFELQGVETTEGRRVIKSSGLLKVSLALDSLRLPIEGRYYA